MNPHIKTIEQEADERYNNLIYHYTDMETSFTAGANRQRELDEQEIAELSKEVERLKSQFAGCAQELEAVEGALDAANDELSKSHPNPALAEVLAKFKPPFRYDGREDVYDANGYALFLRITDEERPIVGNAIAEWLNNQVKKEGV